MTDPYFALDPAQRALAEQFAGLALTSDTLSMVRMMMDGQSDLVDPLPAGVSRTDVNYAARDGEPLRALLYQPTDLTGPTPLIVNIHGGGLVMGSPESNDQRHVALCAEMGVAILAVSYRLAPEHPFPTPLDDCEDGFQFAKSMLNHWNCDPSKMALSGDSAGGGLAAGLSQRLRDGSDRSLKLLLLNYPMLDARTGMEVEIAPIYGQHVWTRGSNRFGWESYLNGQPKDAPASPAACEDLSGLPPTWIGCGALDLFLPEDLDYAERLIAAGVDVSVNVYPGTIHAFQLLPDIEMTRRFNRDYREAIVRNLL